MKLGRLISAFIITLLFLLFFEILSTAVIPALGIQKYRPAFYMLIVIFLAFKLELPFLAIMIFIIQWFHSAFTIEGWAIGTFGGVVTSMVVSSIKDVMHLNSVFVTMVSVQLLLFFWFLVESVLIYLKVENLNYLLERFKIFFPESVVLALISPLLFFLLEKLWKTPDDDKMGVSA